MAAGEVWTRLVFGTGSVEKFIAVWLTLAEPAKEILEWRKSVDIEKATVVPEGVLLYNHLRTRCLYATPDGESASPGIPERGICGVRERWGRILHHSADVEFVVHVPVPGAESGMEATVTEAYVMADSSLPRREVETGHITGVLDQSLVGLTVRVTDPVFAQVHSGEGLVVRRVPSGEQASGQAPIRKRRKRCSRTERPADPEDLAFLAACPGTWVHRSAFVPELKQHGHEQ